MLELSSLLKDYVSGKSNVMRIIIFVFFCTGILIVLPATCLEGATLNTAPGQPRSFLFDGYSTLIPLDGNTGVEIQNSLNHFKIPNNIKRYELVTLNLLALHQRLEAAEDLDIIIQGKEYIAHLTRMDFENINDGIDTYSGILDGEKESSIILTISNQVIVGSVTLGDETFYVDPIESKDIASKQIPTIHIIYSSKDVEEREILIDNGPQKQFEQGQLPDIRKSSGKILQPTKTTFTQSSPETDERILVDILVATDDNFYSQNPDWIAIAQDIIAQANQEFGRDDIKLVLYPVYDDDPARRATLSSHPEIISAPLSAFRDVYPDSFLNDHSIDIGLYLGGNDIPLDTKQGESDYFSGGRHAWVQMVFDDPWYWGTTQGRRCVTIHELGHIFGADHDNSGGFNQAFEWYVGHDFHHTVMWHSYVEGKTEYEFSSDDSHGDTMHDNARRIRETKNTVAHYAEGFQGFILTSDYGAHGRTVPGNQPYDGQKIIAGDSFSYTILADPGYVINKVWVGPIPVNDASGKETYIYTISNIQQDTLIRATFTKIQDSYTVVSSAGSHGMISPLGDIIVPRGSSPTFTITPDPGYSIKDVLIDGSSIGQVPTYTFPEVLTDHRIRATFETAFFIITPTAGAHGQISPSLPVTIPKGESQTFTITPDSGYSIKEVLVDGNSVGPVPSYSFTNVQENHRIKATFEGFTLTPTAGAHGEILPSTPVTVPRGGSQTFYIISDPGYLIKDVAVDGTSVGSVPSYTFTNVQDDHKIKATYKQTKQTFTIIPSAGSHGTISPSTPVMVPYAGSQTFTITPDSGYAVDRVLVNGQSVGSVTSYSFSSVLADQTISATFKQLAPRTTNCFGDRIDNGEAPFRFEYTGPGVPPEYEGGPHWIWYTERCANSYATVAPEYAHPGTAANGVRIGCQNAESGGWKYGYTQMYQGGEYPGFDPEWAIYIPPGAKISFWYKTMMTGSDSGYDVTRIEYYGTRTYPSTLLVSAASKGWTYGEFSLPPASETLWEVNFVAMASNGHSTELWLSNIYAECPVGVEGTAQYQGIQTSSAISPSSWRALNGTEAPV